MQETDDRDRNSPQPERIGETFRSGSLTVIGIIVAFSLGFLTRWGGAPGSWTGADYAAVAAITIGICFELVALASMLSTRSLEKPFYDRVARSFMIGMALVIAGVLIALSTDILGFGQRILRD
jgi:hypothetical protein